MQRCNKLANTHKTNTSTTKRHKLPFKDYTCEALFDNKTVTILYIYIYTNHIL